jgi:cell wall-associated NlpC family hydrolase
VNTWVVAWLLGGVAVQAPGIGVRLLSSVDGSGKPPDALEKLVRLGTTVTLHAVVDRKTVADAPLTVRWSKVEAADHWVSNTDPTFHWHPIRYQEVALPACDDQLTCRAQVRAGLLHDHGGVGTMAFRVVVSQGERRGASPGAEKLYRGGLSSEVARVTVRRDDSYLGYLTELYNTPYIWGSAGEPDTVHQAERRIGSDCADFVTYGVRRMGHRVPYTSTWHLPTHAREISRSTGPSVDGIYRDGKGVPIPVGEKGARPGDLLLFPRHVGALLRDEPPLGVLSVGDVMAHTCWREPLEQPVAETDYASQPVRVLRWKVLERGAR